MPTGVLLSGGAMPASASRSSVHFADIAGNLIASGVGSATLRDYAKLGVLYLQNGMWEAAIASAMVWFSAAKSIG
jgi:hypothetical protein